MVGLFTLRSDGSMELEKLTVCKLETYVTILSEILLLSGPGSTVLIKMSLHRMLLHCLFRCRFRRKIPNSFVGSQRLETSLLQKEIRK